MIGCFYVLKDEDLDAVVKVPKRIHQLWSVPQSPKSPSFISRLLGVKPQPAAEPEQWKPLAKPDPFDVDKAWQGIHFLLTGSDREGEGDLAFILKGGREIAEDLGYGPPHGFTSSEVKKIASALAAVNPAALYERADPEEFTEKDIYPQIWATEPKEQCIRYVIEHFTGLQKFINNAAQADRALIVYIG